MFKSVPNRIWISEEGESLPQHNPDQFSNPHRIKNTSILKSAPDPKLIDFQIILKTAPDPKRIDFRAILKPAPGHNASIFRAILKPAPGQNASIFRAIRQPASQTIDFKLPNPIHWMQSTEVR